MTTPPLDRMSHNHGPGGGPGLACREHRTGDCIIQALTARAEAAEAESKVLRSAVETSNDAWVALTTRADAAEKAVAAVRELHALDTHVCECGDTHGPYCKTCQYDYPCPTITALDTHTPETETTP